MRRSTKTIIAAVALLLLLAGTALATRIPVGNHGQGPLAASQAAESESPEAPLTAADAAHFADRLHAAGITATGAAFQALATKYGAGGAVRLMVWAKATGKSTADIAKMRDGGMGWGQIAHALHQSPAIGMIMGGGSDAADGKAAESDEPEPSESPES
jgi:hypothetical protein